MGRKGNTRRRERRARPVFRRVTQDALSSEAWLLRGISSIPGELRLREGNLSFTAHGAGSAWPWQLRKLERQVGTAGLARGLEEWEDRVVFRWPAAELKAWCPWVYFGGGLKVRHAGVTLRFSLGQPANTQVNVGGSGSPLAAGQAIENFSEVKTMRQRGRMWLAALTGVRAVL